MLLGVRALDYRYRFANPLALSFFLGASRYDLATPAYGYYLGAGVQWRDILPGFDLAWICATPTRSRATSCCRPIPPSRDSGRTASTTSPA